MARFLFSTLPVPGHLDWGGLLETAQLLVRRGHAVLWASGAQVAAQLERAGVPLAIVPVAFPGTFRPHGATGQQQLPFEEVYAAEMRAMLEMWVDERQVEQACDAHLELIRRWRPDVIIADPFVIGAALAAEASGVALAGCGYPGPFTVFMPLAEAAPVAAEFQERRNRLRAHLGLRPLAPEPTPAFLFIADDLHLVYFSAQWFSVFNPRPSPGARFVGGSAPAPALPPPDWLPELPADRPLILVAQPTGYQVERTPLPAIFAALERVGAVGILGGATEQRDQLATLPAHIRWEAWLPYEHVLPRAAAIVHHGGTGTTHDAICWGVPQIVVPEAVDQFLHARAVLASGVGLSLRRDQLTAETVATALERVLTQERFRAAARRLRDQFAGLGGVPRAADLLEDLALRRSPTRQPAGRRAGSGAPPTCRICGSQADHRTFRMREMMIGLRHPFSYFQCADCGCLQIGAVPADLARYYGEGYYSFRSDPRQQPAELMRTLALQFLQTYFGQDRFTTASAILDVGCGAGGLLYGLREAGYTRLAGIDAYLPTDICYPNGLTIQRRTLAELDDARQWDLIMFNHSFEHMDHQEEVLRLVASRLTGDGVCLLRMPTVSSYAWRTYGVDWVGVDAPRHLYIHSLESIALLAERAGLVLVETRYDSFELQFIGSEQYRRDIPLLSQQSYLRNPQNALFSPEQIEEFRRRSAWLNAMRQGDSAAFYLRKAC